MLPLNWQQRAGPVQYDYVARKAEGRNVSDLIAFDEGLDVDLKSGWSAFVFRAGSVSSEGVHSRHA